MALYLWSRWVVSGFVASVALMPCGLLPLCCEARAAVVVSTRLQPDYDKLAPFEAVRWPNGEGIAPIEVLVAGQWHTLQTIDGLDVAKILQFCSDTWGPSLVVKRFEEDLVEAMSRMGSPPKATVNLGIVNSTDTLVQLPAEMTRDNRRALLHAGRARATNTPEPTVTRADARQLAQGLVDLLARSHSYTAIAPQATQAALQALPDSIQTDLTSSDLDRLLMRALALTGDGHASLHLTGISIDRPSLPLVAWPIGDPAQGHLLALNSRGAMLLDDQHPYLAAIEGKPIAEVMQACANHVARGSPQFVRFRSARVLSFPKIYWDDLRLKPLQPADLITMTLTNGQGSTREIRLPRVTSPLRSPNWPRSDFADSRVLQHGSHTVAYLRIPEMEGGREFELAVNDKLNALVAAGCDRLVIDVRGNGGGRRDLINILLPRLLPASHNPLVYNAARPIRLADEDQAAMDDRMASRFLRRADDAAWAASERQAIAAYISGFKPEITVPEDRFGPWYFAAVSPASPKTPRPFKRVAVLLDPGCFSATDIFLGAIRQVPNVTLVGEPSGGGSGLTRKYEVKATPTLGAELYLSSMVSFQPDGRLFDGRGVEPHVLAHPTIDDLLDARSDTMLQTAITILLAP